MLKYINFDSNILEKSRKNFFFKMIEIDIDFVRFDNSNEIFMVNCSFLGNNLLQCKFLNMIN